MSIKDDLKWFFKQNSWELNKLKGGEVFYYIEDNFKPSLPTTIAWYIESQNLQGINNEYDKGWYDCLQMVAEYFSEN